MKKQLYLFLLLFLTTEMLSAQIIENPSLETRTGSIFTISKIELTPQQTRLFIDIVFPAGWWIETDKNIYIQNTETGEKYYCTQVEGIKFNEKFYMPESGKAQFTLTYPALPKEVKKINLIDETDNEGAFYGISLVPEKKDKTKKLFRQIAGNWLKTDGTNDWAYGFYDSLAVFDNQYWKYASVKKKGKRLRMEVLNDKGEQVLLEVTPQKDSTCLIKKEGKEEVYSKTPGKKKIYENNLLHATQFFKSDTARIRGYLKGYSPKLGFTTGLIYIGNEITREDYPTVLTIHPDGRFEADFPLHHPVQEGISLNNTHINFYIEPGETLFIYLDWEDILAKARTRNYDTPLYETRYMGPSGHINEELAKVNPLFRTNYSQLYNDKKKLTPAQFKEKQDKIFQGWQELADSLVATGEFTPKGAHLLKNMPILTHGEAMFDFIMDRNYDARQDTTNKVLQVKEDKSYYDFLRHTPLDDVYIMAHRSFSSFINRFEYMQPFRDTYPDSVMVTIHRSFALFLSDKGIKLTEEEQQLAKHDREVLEKEFITARKDLSDWDAPRDALAKKYATWFDEYQKLDDKDNPAVSFRYFSRAVQIMNERRQKQKIVAELTGKADPLAWQIAQVRSYPYWSKSIEDRKDAHILLDTLRHTVKVPLFIAEAERIYHKIYPKENKKSYALPEGKGTEIFRKIIDPYKGKILFIDFWATTCGPCRGGIEEMAPLRKKYKDSKDFKFIYITSINESPENDYNEYVEKNLKGEAIYRIPMSDYHHLRQLFHFNGIPRYVLIDRDGNVMDEDYNGWNLDYDLKTGLLK